MAIIPTKTANAAWSVDDFEIQRPHLTEFVRDNLIHWLNDEDCRRILIRAPVKSGKREIVEYISVRDHSMNPHRIHAFISAWHRTADETQRLELTLHNMQVFSVSSTKKATECINWVESRIRDNKQTILHIDECDFGAGARQILGKIYKKFRENELCKFLLYSATPQEVLFSGEVDNKEDAEYDELVEEIRQTGVCIEYTPPAGYCGPARFLEEGLVSEANPFFIPKTGGGISLTPQGSQIVADFKENLKTDPNRNIMILRLSSGSGKYKENKHIYQFLTGASSCEGLAGFRFVTAKSDMDTHIGDVRISIIEWSNRRYWEDLVTGHPFIFVIDQTASRSTELACHDRIFAYHEFRNTVCYTTVSQAQERVNHYEQKYGGFQRIKVYGHLKTFKLSAGRISYGEYMNNDWHKKKIVNKDLYLIKKKIDGTIHPDYSEPMNLPDADTVLQILGCFAEVKVSDRVRGGIKFVPYFGCEFVPCTNESFFENIQPKLHELNIQQTFQNPFIKSLEKGTSDGKLKGYLREWKVFNLSEVEKNKGWGMNGARTKARLSICYLEDQIGVAIRWKTDAIVKIDTLETFKSMYRR